VASLALARPRLRKDVGRLAIATVGAAATGALLACSLRIVLAAAVDPAYLVPSGRRTGYPLWMRGPLAAHSQPLHVHMFILLMAVMVGAWLCVLVCARHMPSWFVAGAIVAATVLFALAPPLLSTDVFNYIAYGQMGTRGINPYLHGPSLLIGQPIYSFTGHLWKYTPSAYGPLFTLSTYLLAPLGVAAALWVLKATAALAVLALTGLAWATSRRLGRDPRFAAVLVGLNPLVLVYAVGGAHNDLLMAAALAAAVYLAVTMRPAAAGAAAVAAIAIKASAGLALPFVLLGARPRQHAVNGAVAAAVLAGGVSLLVFGGAITNMASALVADQHFDWIVVSIPNFLAHYAGVSLPGHMARTCLAAFAAITLIVLIARSRGGRGWIEGAAGATLIVLATTAWLLPWYVVWALPFVALVRRRAVLAGAIVITALLVAMQLDHLALTLESHHQHHHVRDVHEHARVVRQRNSRRTAAIRADGETR
jgi:alpha-1,6-mannosyltransferase